jgi:transketolase N-terminal domain/subunit
MSDSVERLKAWLVTGPLGRGLSFAIDFAAALRTFVSR